MSPLNAEAPPAVTAASQPNPRNNVAMFTIFQNVQYNVVQHKKYVKEMMKLYKKLDPDVFRESFKNALQYLFTFGDTSANVDRVVQFVATFCATLGDEEEFFEFIFEIIFECQCVSGQSVRYRASQLLAAVLAALGEDASLDDVLCDKLLTSQLNRMQDTRSAVRCRAALSLQRLQNPPDDEVTRAYRFHMGCDPSASVRRAVLMSIAKIRQNVPWVLCRLCDVDEAVRRAAFLFMAAMPVTLLKVMQRMMTLKVGLTERSARVRRVVEEILIPGWLSSFRGNIVDLLKAIRLDNSEDAEDSKYVAGKLLESLFKRLPISELLEWLPIDKMLRLIPAEQLNKDTAWYWRHLAQHLQAIDDEEALETVLPDLVVLTGYIRVILESPCPSEEDDPESFSTRQYVLHELACMLRVYDASDPAGRTALRALINDALTGDYGALKPEVLRAFVAALQLVVPDVSQRMEVVAQVITYLRDSAEPEPDPTPTPPPPAVVVDDTQMKLVRTRLRVSLNVAIEAQEEAVREQNYALAAECKAKVEKIQKELEDLQSQCAPPPPPPPVPIIKEKLSESGIMNKCLTILNAALDTPHLKTITPMLQTIFNDLELEIYKNKDIKENALETVALYGMLSKEFLDEKKPFIFANVSEGLNDPISLKAIQCLVDLMCVHGARAFEDKPAILEDSAQSTGKNLQLDEAVDCTISQSMLALSADHNDTINVLLRIMSDNCPQYRAVVVEGLCRLLHLGHLESPLIICKLILLWFNPANVEEDIVRQTIGVFFQTFPISVDSAQEQIQKAAILVIRTLANAPSSSPLTEIDQEAVVRFIVSLTRVNYDLSDSQGAMALALSHHVSRQPAAPEAALVCRMLALLAPPRECRLAAQLAALLRDALLKLPDKQSCRNLTRYLGALEATERASLKMSNSGIPEGTLQGEDTMSIMGRATSSLPQPLARSTHVVINETVEEEVEIYETSPADTISKISEIQAPETSPKSSGHATDVVPAPELADDESHSSDSNGASPVKKSKVIKGKKKKLPATKESSDSKKSEPQEKKSKPKPKVAAGKKGAVKRSRSQRSLVDVARVQKAKAEALAKTSPPKTPSPPPARDLDASNVTVRKSVRRAHSASSVDSNGAVGSSAKEGGKAAKKKGKTAKPVTRNSAGSARSSAGSSRGADDSSDETQLHTIIYDNDFEQSLLNDSELQESKQASKANLTIPETPEGSNESESEPEPEPVPVKAKGKRNGKK